jgi:hypothetical protein
MAINIVKTAFTNMSYTPDVPSNALSAQEYNSGINVESDLRGIKTVLGEKYILSSVPGAQIFNTAGFQNGNDYTFVVANTGGDWYTVQGNVWIDGNIANVRAVTTKVTPTANYTPVSYTVNTPITDSWNGEINFINDSIHAPMYLLPNETNYRLYDVAYPDQTNAPGNVYIWNYDVATATANVGGITVGDTVKAFSSLSAGFMRLYAAPNVGSILVAGNFTATLANITTLGTTGTVVNYPTQLRWSQAFGLNSGPTSWAPTATNIANQLEVPVRGPLIDGFPHQGNFYICSYWDTCVLSPIAYQSTSAPVFGLKIINIGRGLLNENCWSNADDVVYGLDARDIWVFNGGSFQSLGNQRVKNWFYGQINQNYLNAVHMVNNTGKNQIEIYYPDAASTGYCNKMLSYRYDLNIWNAPREVANAIHAYESPTWNGNIAALATRTVVYGRGGLQNSRLVQKDVGSVFVSNVGNVAIQSTFERNNISLADSYSKKVQIHRILPEITGSGTANITVGGADSVGAATVYKPTGTFTISTTSPWVQIDQNDVRTVSIKLQGNSSVGSWETTAINWQVSVIEDAR